MVMKQSDINGINVIFYDKDYKNKRNLVQEEQNYVNRIYSQLMSLDLPSKQDTEDLTDLNEALQQLQDNSVGKLYRDVSHALDVAERYHYKNDISRNALEDAMHEIYEDGFKIAPYMSSKK